jgi:6-pyruvoyltetrahydropterin/6-carboxytetrahydropterin synthase
MQVTRRASVERNRLRFAAAHFATFREQCESLHGHNYDVTVDVEGPLTDDAWVCDFGDLKQMARELAEQLDHKFLLQLDSKVLKITEHQASWEVTFGERTFVFPRTDVAPLNIDNSTAERLAEWFGNSLWGRLEVHRGGAIRKLTVGIEEMPGQAGWYTLER